MIYISRFLEHQMQSLAEFRSITKSITQTSHPPVTPVTPAPDAKTAYSGNLQYKQLNTECYIIPRPSSNPITSSSSTPRCP